MSRKYFYGLLILMLGCGAAVCVGKLDNDVSLESVSALWSDVLRDADETGMKATRISADREMKVGEEIAGHFQSANDPERARYVSAVGMQLVPGVERKAIRYQFHVIQSPEINAFAEPGGQVYVLTGMLDFVQSESELAAILGHEISHVDLRHCVERYQYQLALHKAGIENLDWMVEIAHSLVTMGYSQDQELEADAAGERLVIERGYDPDAAAEVFERLKAKLGEGSEPVAVTPGKKMGQAVGGFFASYFQTHPSSAERVRRLRAMTAANRSRLAGGLVYRGVRNYQEKIPRSRQEFAGERRVY